MTKESDNIRLCNKGDTFYRVGMYEITEITILDVEHYTTHYVYRASDGNTYFNHSFIKSCFKTKEEAEAEFLRRARIKEKREKLKAYERKLNEEMNIGEHYIIK